MGLDFQFCGRPLSLEIPAPLALSRARNFWRAAPLDGNVAGGAAGSARPERGSLWPAQTSHAAPAAHVPLHGTASSVSFRHGRWTNAKAHLFRGAGENSLSGATLAKNVARTGNGRCAV